MRKVYLTCLERNPYGGEPSSISFFARSIPVELGANNIKQSLNHVLESKKSPRQILVALEKKVFDQTGYSPSLRDILQGTSQDNDKKYADWQRIAGYLAEAAWPRKGQTQKQADQIAKENNATRNRTLLKIYIEYAKQICAEQIA
jgi:hypothetical protein